MPTITKTNTRRKNERQEYKNLKTAQYRNTNKDPLEETKQLQCTEQIVFFLSDLFYNMIVHVTKGCLKKKKTIYKRFHK